MIGVGLSAWVSAAITTAASTGSGMRAIQRAANSAQRQDRQRRQQRGDAALRTRRLVGRAGRKARPHRHPLDQRGSDIGHPDRAKLAVGIERIAMFQRQPAHRPPAFGEQDQRDRHRQLRQMRGHIAPAVATAMSGIDQRNRARQSDAPAFSDRANTPSCYPGDDHQQGARPLRQPAKTQQSSQRRAAQDQAWPVPLRPRPAPARPGYSRSRPRRRSAPPARSGNCLTMIVAARPKENPRSTGREMNPDRPPSRSSASDQERLPRPAARSPPPVPRAPARPAHPRPTRQLRRREWRRRMMLVRARQNGCAPPPHRPRRRPPPHQCPAGCKPGDPGISHRLGQHQPGHGKSGEHVARVEFDSLPPPKRG